MAGVADVRGPCLVGSVAESRSGSICGDIENQYGRQNGEDCVGEGPKSVRLHLQEVSVNADPKGEHSSC